MDLDKLLADLDITTSVVTNPQLPPPPPRAPAAAGAPTGVSLSELDDLMSDLGVSTKPTTATTPKQPTPVPPVVESPHKPVGVSLAELDDLMGDLSSIAPAAAAKAPTTTPQPTVSHTRQGSSPPPPLAPATTVKTKVVLQKATAVEVKAPQQQQPPQVQKVTTDSVADDLDDLMKSLDEAAASKKPPVVATKPAVPPPAAPSPAAVMPPPPPPTTAAPAVVKKAHTPVVPAPTGGVGLDALDDLLGQIAPSSSSAPANTRALPPPPPPPQEEAAEARPSPTVPKKKADDLDNLLNNLTSDVNNVTVNTAVSRGICARCNKPVTGEVIQAMGKIWHPDHWTCGSCQTLLGTSSFFESQGQPTCERCWKVQYCPRCAGCDQPIMDRCLTALGKKWHPEHFICTVCLQPLNGGFFERDGNPYCETHFYEQFSPKCAGCEQPIRGECINALGQKWHPEHFACAYCKKTFGTAPFFEYNRKPYCEAHYHQMSGAICAGCGKPCTGKSISALGKRWHPEHLVCSFCCNPLGTSSYKEQAGKAYCNTCYGNLFS